MIVSTKQLAEVLDVSDRTVRHWAANGLPKVGHNQFDLKTALQWWLLNIYDDDETPDLQMAKTSYWGHKARIEKVKADEAEKSVMPVKEIHQAWAWRVSEMRNGLLALPLRLSSIIAGKSELETRRRLEDEIWTILDRYSRTGKFTPDVSGKS